jgi:hypothetical protein
MKHRQPDGECMSGEPRCGRRGEAGVNEDGYALSLGETVVLGTLPIPDAGDSGDLRPHFDSTFRHPAASYLPVKEAGR